MKRKEYERNALLKIAFHDRRTSWQLKGKGFDFQPSVSMDGLQLISITNSSS